MAFVDALKAPVCQRNIVPIHDAPVLKTRAYFRPKPQRSNTKIGVINQAGAQSQSAAKPAAYFRADQKFIIELDFRRNIIRLGNWMPPFASVLVDSYPQFSEMTFPEMITRDQREVSRDIDFVAHRPGKTVLGAGVGAA